MPADLNKRRQKRTLQLKDAMEIMLHRNFMMGEYKRQAVAANWPKIVGEIMAKRTEKVRVVDNTLLITVNSAPMKHQMMVNKSRIIALVNTFIGEHLISDVFID